MVKTIPNIIRLECSELHGQHNHGSIFDEDIEDLAINLPNLTHLNLCKLNLNLDHCLYLTVFSIENFKKLEYIDLRKTNVIKKCKEGLKKMNVTVID